MQPYKSSYQACQKAFTRRTSLKRDQKKPSDTIEDAVPQLSAGYASPEVDQLDRSSAVPLPSDRLLTPESISYTSVLEPPCYGRFQKPIGVEDSIYISRIENLEEAIEVLHGDIQTLIDRVAKLEGRDRTSGPVASHDDIALV